MTKQARHSAADWHCTHRPANLAAVVPAKAPPKALDGGLELGALPKMEATMKMAVILERREERHKVWGYLACQIPRYQLIWFHRRVEP